MSASIIESPSGKITPIVFRTLLQVSEGVNDEALTEFCSSHLRSLGYDVAAPNEKWETLGQFIERLGVSYETFHRVMKRDGRPNVAIHFTATGRVRELCSNPAFDAFVKRYKTPEKQ